MTKIVYNSCFGGFGLSYEGVMDYAARKGLTIYAFTDSRKPNGALDFHKKAPVDATNAADAFYIYYFTSPNQSDDSHFSDRDIDRADPALVATVEALGEKANGRHASLCIEEIPAGTKYRIDEYDGSESVMTIDDYAWKTA